MGEVNDLKLSSTNGPANPSKRVCCSREQLETLSREEILERWLKQDLYIDSLEAQLASLQSNNGVLEEKLRNSQGEAARRENLLLMKLSSKEQEAQDLMVQIQELKMSQASNEASLRCSLLDPAVNMVIQRLRQELDKTKSLLEETQNELSAWKFTPDSNTGKRLMAKCRLLYQENEELGRITSVGRLAKLEGDLALQKNFSEEMKKSQSELDEFLQELDEDVEGMQSTIYYLQQQLRQARDQLAELKSENEALRSGGASCLPSVKPNRSDSHKSTRDDNNTDTSPFTTEDADRNERGQQDLSKADANHRETFSTTRSDKKLGTDGALPEGQDRTSVSHDDQVSSDLVSDSDRTERTAASDAVASDKCRKRTASQSQVDCDSNHVPTTVAESKEPQDDERNSRHPSKRLRQDSTDSSHVTNGQNSPMEDIAPDNS